MDLTYRFSPAVQKVAHRRFQNQWRSQWFRCSQRPELDQDRDEPTPKTVPSPSNIAESKPQSEVKSPSAPVSSPSGIGFSSPVTTSESKAHCPILDFPNGVMNQSVINGAAKVTGVAYNCVGLFAGPATTWATWETPWMFASPADGFGKWLEASPARRIVMAMDLIPLSAANTSNPLAWEQPCGAGAYNKYATALARNLVARGGAG